MIRFLAFIVLCMVTTITQAQPSATLQLPGNTSVFIDSSDINFAVYPPESQGQPAFGVRFDGTLLFRHSAFLPELFGFNPAERQLGWLRAEIGGVKVLIPIWLAKDQR